MSDRVIVVTGAGRGIGAATVRRLLAAGHRVVGVDWCVGASPDAPYPQATRAELDEVCDHPSAVAVEADVRDPAAVRAAVDIALDRWGRIDAAVAAAAVLAGGASLWETAPSDLDLLFGVDVLGIVHLARAVVPALLAGPDPRGARFVAVASAAGDRGLYRLGGYSAAKHAAVGVIRGLAADLVGTGVTAVAVSPGSTRTAMLDATAAVYGLPDPGALAEHQLIRRLIEPDEIAAVIEFCCSPAGAVLNGSVVHADGGFTA